MLKLLLSFDTFNSFDRSLIKITRDGYTLYKYFEPHSRSLSVSGHLTPLHTGGMVDTGMGLERVVAVLGDKWTTAGNNMTPDVCRNN